MIILEYVVLFQPTNSSYLPECFLEFDLCIFLLLLLSSLGITCSPTWDLLCPHYKDFYLKLFILLIYLAFFCFVLHVTYLYFFSFIFISWRLITSQHCSGFCHTLTWISHGVTCIPHPDPPSHLPLYPIPLGLPSAPGLSTCLMHPIWAGDLFTIDNIHAVLSKHPTLAFSQRV